MNRTLRINSNHKFVYSFIGISIIASLLLNLFGRYLDGFAQWYAINIYPIFPSVIGRIYGLFGFSFFEAGIILLSLLLCIFFLTGIWMVLSNNPRKNKYFSSGIRVLLSIVSVLILLYTLFCSINYQRDSIGEILQLPKHEISGDKLEKLSLILADDLEALTRDEDWEVSLQLMYDMDYVKFEVISAMKQLAQKDSSFSGYYPKSKPIYHSELLTKFGIEGFFSPYTMETNYNSDMTPFLVPYTIGHELAHLKGYMKEEDAGFIAYLACKGSSSKLLQYSGTFKALNFSLNALKSEIGVQDFNEVYQKLPESVKTQLYYINEPKTEADSLCLSITKRVNNAYLQANAQADGIKSYVNMVQFLVSHYADKITPESLI